MYVTGADASVPRERIRLSTAILTGQPVPGSSIEADLRSAYKNTDKVIIPVGTDPYLFIGGTPGSMTLPVATPTTAP